MLCNQLKIQTRKSRGSNSGIAGNAYIWPFRVCDYCDLDLEAAQSYVEMAAIQYFGLPDGARELLQTSFEKAPQSITSNILRTQNSGATILWMRREAKHTA